MTFRHQTYYSKIYRDFEEIRGRSYQSVIAFCERHVEDIKYLPFREQFDLYCEYADALFETCEYRKQIELADKIIEDSIFYNIKYHRGTDIYLETLFKKAAGLYNLNRLDKSICILKELRNIDPHNRDYTLFLYRCNLKRRPEWLDKTRAIFFFLFITVAILFVLETFALKPGSSSVNMLESTRIAILFFAFGTLIAGEGLHLIKSYLKAFSR